MGGGIQAVHEANELLLVMTLCRHNGAMEYMYKFVKVLSTELCWHGKFLWKQYFDGQISNFMKNIYSAECVRLLTKLDMAAQIL